MTNKSFCHIFYSVLTGMLVSYHLIYVRPRKTYHMYLDSKKVGKKKKRGGGPPPTATLHLREGGGGGWLHPYRRGNGGGSNPDHLCGGGEIHPCTSSGVATPHKGVQLHLHPSMGVYLHHCRGEATPTAWSYPPPLPLRGWMVSGWRVGFPLLFSFSSLSLSLSGV